MSGIIRMKHIQNYATDAPYFWKTLDMLHDVVRTGYHFDDLNEEAVS